LLFNPFIVVVEDMTSRNSNRIGHLILATMGILGHLILATMGILGHLILATMGILELD